MHIKRTSVLIVCIWVERGLCTEREIAQVSIIEVWVCALESNARFIFCITAVLSLKSRQMCCEFFDSTDSITKAGKGGKVKVGGGLVQ